MPSDPIQRADWLRQARAIFAEAHGAPTGKLTVVLRDDAGQEVSYTLPNELPPGPVPALSPLEAQIVRAIGTATMIAKAIASRIGAKNDPAFRVILANLVERGVLQSTQQGYRVLPVHQASPRQ